MHHILLILLFNAVVLNFMKPTIWNGNTKFFIRQNKIYLFDILGETIGFFKLKH